MVFRHTRKVVSFLSCAKGATIVECALTLPFFLITIFIALEFAYLTFMQLALQYSLNQAARYVSMQPSAPGEFQYHFLRFAKNFGIGFPLDEENFFDFYDTSHPECLARNTRCGAELDGPNGSNESTIIRVRHPAKLLLLPTTYELSATVTKRNEPYDPNS